MAREDSNPADELPVVVASNRLPFTFRRTEQGLSREPSPGGLVSALEPLLRKRGGTWVGWPGIDVWEEENVAVQGEAYRIHPVPLSEIEVQRYYHGFSNRTLWPLLHSLPARARFDRRDWETYERVNERFAEATVEEAADGGIIWVHDYQLMLSAPGIRRALPRRP